MSLNENGGKKPLSEVFRWLTPMLITIAIYQLGTISSTVSKLDEKVFKHLTNDEIHTPKSIVVNKAEFEIYQSFRDKQMSDLKETFNKGMTDIKCSIDKLQATKR